MTYRAVEESVAAGRPFELYRFSRGVQCWYYTSADHEIDYLGDAYLPVAINRGSIESTDEDRSGSVEVTLSRRLSLTGPFVANTPATPIWLTIFRGHGGESEVAVIFEGQIAAVSFRNEEAVLNCMPIQGAIARPAPRMVYQRICNHMLYDSGCTVDKKAYRTIGVVESVNGIYVTVPEVTAKPDGYFGAGYFELAPSDPLFGAEAEPKAFITFHAGTTLTLLVPMPGLVPGMTLWIYAGCDRRVETCHQKFANLPNFMGFPYIPYRNPFDGGVI